MLPCKILFSLRVPNLHLERDINDTTCTSEFWKLRALKIIAAEICMFFNSSNHLIDFLQLVKPKVENKPEPDIELAREQQQKGEICRNKSLEVTDCRFSAVLVCSTFWNLVYIIVIVISFDSCVQETYI